MQFFKIKAYIYFLFLLFIMGCAIQKPKPILVEKKQIPTEVKEVKSEPEPVVPIETVKEYARIHQISDLKTAEFRLTNPTYARQNPYTPNSEDIEFYERDFLEKMYPGFKEMEAKKGFMSARKFYMDNPPAGPGSTFIGSRRYGAIMQQIAAGGGEGASTGAKDVLFEEDPVTVNYKQAMRLHKLGRLDEAIEYMQKAVKAKPDAPSLLYTMGVMYMDKGDNTSAIQYMQSAVKYIKGTGFTKVNLAMYSDAYMGALTNLGLIYTRIGMYEDAIKALNEAILFRQGDLDANYNLVNTYYVMGDMAKTAGQLRKFLNLDPENAEAHNLAGLIYYRQKLYSAALDEFRTAEKLNPDEKQYSHNLGTVLAETGNEKEAVQAFLRADGFAEGSEVRQQYLEQKAENTIREVYNKGAVAMEVRSWRQAIKHFSEVLESKPDMMEAHLNLGVCYRMVGDSKNQIYHFEQAAKLKPDMPNIHYNLGLAYSDAKMYTEAGETFKKAIELDPSLKDAHFSLGTVLFRTRKYADAAAQFEKCLELDPGMVEAHLNLGSCYLKLDRSSDALEQFEIAAQLDPKSAEAQFNLGVVYRNLGKFDEATELFQKCLELDPAYKEARVMLKELENLQSN